jgi:hypothetical protein
MNGALPYLFFFSYSRADWEYEYDVYLAKFFEDLGKKVAIVAGAGIRKVGFRDEEGVKTGEDWTCKISAAVQTSHVLVCVYTANFFSAERTHEFCAKEFMAFLKRDPQLRYERVVDNVGRERYEVHEARNILPILWLSERELVVGRDDRAAQPPGHRTRQRHSATRQPGMAVCNDRAWPARLRRGGPVARWRAAKQCQ